MITILRLVSVPIATDEGSHQQFSLRLNTNPSDLSKNTFNLMLYQVNNGRFQIKVQTIFIDFPSQLFSGPHSHNMTFSLLSQIGFVTPHVSSSFYRKV